MERTFLVAFFAGVAFVGAVFFTTAFFCKKEYERG